MMTLVIFAALCYLVGHMPIEAKAKQIACWILSIAGAVIWLLGCIGVEIPNCFRA